MKFSKRPRPFIFAAIILLFAAIVVSQVSSKKPLDLSKEEAPFPSIKMPPQAVYGSGYMDGGSVGVRIVDGAGANYDFMFLIDYDAVRNAHPTAFFGHFNSKMIELKNPKRAKEIIIHLLDRFGKEITDPRLDSHDHTARAQRDLESPPDIVAIRLFEKARRKLRY
jgi:hypothetical protein